MAQTFRGLSADLFGLYVPAKWSSNVHNLPRMRSKDALVALARDLEATSSVDLSSLARAASDEMPNMNNHKRVEAQWVFWSRDATERRHLASFLEKMPLGDASIFTVALHEKHVSLALRLDAGGLTVGVFVPEGASVDRRNLASKWSQSWERKAALDLFAALPPGATCSLGDAAATPVAELADASLAELAGKLGGKTGTLTIGLVLPAAACEARGEALAAEVAGWLAPLFDIYRFVAWHRSNDAIEAGKQIQAERAEKRRHATPFQKKDAVRVVGGLFRGQRGTVVECSDPRGQVKVLVGKMSVLIARDDLVSA